jgi:hypothetical protein
MDGYWGRKEWKEVGGVEEGGEEKGRKGKEKRIYIR